LDELDRPGLEPLYRKLLPGEPKDARWELEVEVEGSQRHLEVMIKPLPGGGCVVAIDDLTQLLRAQRQAAWSEVAQRIAHEIKNPLTPIRLAAERMQRWAQRLQGDVRDIMMSGSEAIIAQVSGLKELVDAFRRYARMPTINPRVASVSRIAREVVSLYQELRDGLTVELRLPEKDLTATVDPVLLRQALVNLLDNAIDAVNTNGSVTLSVSSQGDDVVLEVADSGVGLPTDDVELLLQPFYSTKGRGSGMGLALVHRIVSDHGGILELENRSPSGAVARIVLTAALESDAREADEGTTSAGHGAM
jgi:two-component system nitrogen regulation sensor histidine kinase NtrY